MVHVATQCEGCGAPGPDDPIDIGLRLRTDAIEITISNRGETPVDVLWDRASLVDTAGDTWGVVRSGAAGGSPTPDVPGNVTRIPAHASLTDYLLPTRSVRFDAYYGWIVEPVLPVECGPIRCVGYHELVGKSVRLTLPVQVNGEERVFEWTLRITETVKSTRGARPSDPNLH
jgi:hypothetical protein